MQFGRVLVLVVACCLFGCGDSSRLTTLSALSSAQKDFNGRRVIVTGTLRMFEPPRHFWIENETLDRVALELQDEQPLIPLVGQAIRVSGKFLYDSKKGRRIEVVEFDLPP